MGGGAGRPRLFLGLASPSSAADCCRSSPFSTELLSLSRHAAARAAFSSAGQPRPAPPLLLRPRVMVRRRERRDRSVVCKSSFPSPHHPCVRCVCHVRIIG